MTASGCCTCNRRRRRPPTPRLYARQSYTSGIIDFQTVLQTQRTQLGAQDSEASAQADLASDHVRLYKALGGGWQPDGQRHGIRHHQRRTNPTLMSTPTPSGADAPMPTPAAAANPQTGAKADLAKLLDEPSVRAWYLRPALWGTALLLLLVGAGGWYWQARQIASAAPSYITQTVAPGDLTVTVSASGTTTPTRAISIGSELSGTVLKVNADINDKIRKGQVLVELDPAKLNDQILRSRATLASANAKVVQTVATTKEATATLDRFEEVARLSGGKVPAKSELDTARATLDRARADEASARAAVNDAQAALSTDEINLSKASIRAPSDGVVLTRNVDPGNAVAASLQAVTLFTIAEDLAQLRVVVYVDEADVGSVAVGQSATFTVSAYPSRNYPARITRVAFGSTITDNVVTYMTDLSVDNSGPEPAPRHDGGGHDHHHPAPQRAAGAQQRFALRPERCRSGRRKARGQRRHRRQPDAAHAGARAADCRGERRGDGAGAPGLGAARRSGGTGGGDARRHRWPHDGNHRRRFAGRHARDHRPEVGAEAMSATAGHP